MDANFSQIAFQRETTWGVTPGSPDTKKARFTAESLVHEKDTVVSKEVRPDRQKTDIVKVGASAKGDLSFELSYSDWKHFFEAALFNPLAIVGVSGVTCAIDHTAQTIEAAPGTFANVVPGCSIRITGAATPANNGVKRVIAKAADGSDITLAAASLTATEASVALDIKASHLKNGLTPFSYYMERKVPATAGGFAYQRFSGMMVDTMELTFESKAIVTGKLGMVGKIGATHNDPLDAAPTETSADSVVNATNNVGSITRGGASMSEKFKKLTLQITNALRGRDAIGEEGNFSVGIGSFDLKGSMESYFKDNALLQSVIDHDYTSLEYRITDPSGNILVFHIPRLVFSSGAAGISGLDTDVMVPLDIQAIRDATYDATLLISFIDAP